MMEKIAIIGLSCLFPEAQTPEQFWQNLIAQKDSISLATEEQMGVEPEIFYDPVKGKTGETGKYYCMKGGYIKKFKFEADGYRFPAEFIEGLDNIYKWSLYVSKQALQDSGYLGNTSVLSKCGIVLGNLSSPTRFSYRLIAPIYQRTIASGFQALLHHQDFRLENLPSPDNISPLNILTAGYPSAVVAQALSLSGINFSLDAACASSLYAIKLACDYLVFGKANLMLAGGVSCTDPYMTHTVFSLFQAYPEDGISRPLDSSSAGMMTGEGAGMLVLKRYSDAIRDGDKIYATILGVGLSNDGGGKHFLSPNPKGQALAFERAYAEADINPQSIDYVECHATGTPLGDRTELNSMEAFFGQYRNPPLVGSVKSNLGHLLTAAGMPSTIKVILSMSQGLIPPTIHLREPLSSLNNAIASEKVVSSVTSWPSQTSLKRAAISAFGFGGTNSHLILERGNQRKPIPSAGTEANSPVQTEKMAIIAMDAYFGLCNSLDAFERSIYEGTQHFIPLPACRWQGIEDQEQLLKDCGFAGAEAPLGAYINDFELDYLQFKIPPDAADQPIPQQLLILKVADNAIRNARLERGANVAVIIAMGTELAAHKTRVKSDLIWQLNKSLKQFNIALPPEKISELETIANDSLLKPIQVNQCLSFIGNIMASRISSLWDFSGPSFTLSAEENSTFKALEVAQMLLAQKKVDAVVVGAVDLSGSVENVLSRNKMMPINTGVQTLSYDRNANGWMVGEGAGAVVLKRLDTAKQDRDRIYSVIDAISLVQGNSTSEADNLLQPPVAEVVTQACQRAFNEAGIKPADISYLEVFGSGVDQEDEAEISGLIQAYKTPEPELSCAIGSIKANIGHTYAASGMASLIKTALCLYHRYIPATPQWSGPKKPEIWQGSPFYVATESRTWSLEAASAKRVAAINGLGIDRTYAHLILSEDVSEQDRSSRYLEQTPFYLFPLAAAERSALLEQLNALQETIDRCSSLAVAATQAFAAYNAHSQPTYALAIVGHNKGELTREIQYAQNGVPKAFDGGGEWKSPLGSYFTAKPLGKQGSVAFVYPGAFNSYIGMGRDIHHLFPSTYDRAVKFTSAESLKKYLHLSTKLLYSRSLERLSKRQMEVLERQLADNPIVMFLSGISAALVYTMIMRNDFRVLPKSAVGYSLGELSMMYALNVWISNDDTAESIESSPLFRTRLSGPKNAVREAWGLPQTQEDASEDFWSTYVLIATVSEVKESLKHEKHVYLTHINTPLEVVIAGDKQGCMRVIKNLKCDHFRAPASHVIHCEPMRSEYSEFVKSLTLPVQSQPQLDFYSAAHYERMILDSQSIARNIAQALCKQLDFPRLINRSYEDGNRIFIELGPGGTCSRWIRETLKQKEHVTMFINSRSVDDHTGIVRVLAKLLSHRVPVDLSPLYSQEKNYTTKRALVKAVTLGGRRIVSAMLTEENQKSFAIQPSPVLSQSVLEQHKPLPIQKPEIEEVASLMAQSTVKEVASTTQGKLIGKVEQREANGNANYNFYSQEPLTQDSPETEQEDHQYIPSFNKETSEHVHAGTFSDLHSFHNQKLSEKASIVTQAHTAFLQARRESLRQMSELIQMQIAVSRHLQDQKPTQENSQARERLQIKQASSGQISTFQEPSDSTQSKSTVLPLQKPASVIFNEADMLEFAAGSISRVFGKEYEIIDSYSRRVRLPMPPYLFISRVTKFEAKRGCFEPCLIETEYDIPQDAWYAVDGQIPCAIPVEACHGNMLLISYIGIDFENQGQRVYRALDGTTTYLGETPVVGETLRCHVRINSFARGGNTLLFFFSYECFVGNRMFLKATSGAGFFSDEVLKKGQGVSLTAQEKKERSKVQKKHFEPLLLCYKSAFNDENLKQLSLGNIAACFGDNYDQKGKNPSLRLPSQAIRMIDRVISVDPRGGCWGLGLVVAEKTLDPKQWYFNCHFKDDLVLPGTIINEGCVQTLLFYLLYLGLQTCTTNAKFQPIPRLTQSGRSRGQITPVSAILTYRLEVTEIGLEPKPFAKAEVAVIFDDKIISLIKNLGIQLSEKQF
ncbi:MAG: PfaB family protein [Chroococcidiopsidaceae cyanobacterium CP_BM_ER_R8_30]|nr:PfaB family protein [Chroococcidiopsidaceae cyanobacterium CP_BM_ER_R8_30]